MLPWTFVTILAGLRSTLLLDAATTSGATEWQTMVEVRAPYAVPTILLGLNQTILYAFAMLVIAALIGTTGLGQSIFLALGKADVGLGIAAGAAMAILPALGWFATVAPASTSIGTGS